MNGKLCGVQLRFGSVLNGICVQTITKTQRALKEQAARMCQAKKADVDDSLELQRPSDGSVKILTSSLSPTMMMTMMPGL